jgi:uncharacterized protein YlxW (UPF0749 family)
VTALLEEIRNVESAEHEQQTADQLAFIFAVWSNTIADAETGRDKMQELGLSYEQVEAGCKLCDERHALAQKLSEAQATMADESAIQSEIDTLDAAKADADRKYAAQRAPLVAKLAALGSAAFVATDCRNKLLKNPLPHVRAKLASLRAKRKPLADESNRATERVKTAEARERWLESALADVAGRLEDRGSRHCRSPALYGRS